MVTYYVQGIYRRQIMLNESINTRISIPFSIFLQRQISPLACKLAKCVIWQVEKEQCQRREKKVLPDLKKASPSHLHPSTCVRKLSCACSEWHGTVDNLNDYFDYITTFRGTNGDRATERERERALLSWITFTALNIFHFTRIQKC